MYFAKILNTHSATNRLKDYVGKQIKSLECNAVDDPEAFKGHLEKLVHRANYRFPRCKPLVSYLHIYANKEDYRAGISEVVEFSLYKQRAVFGLVTPVLPATPVEVNQTTLFT